MLKVPAKNIYIDFVRLNYLVWGRRIFLNGEDITVGFLKKLSRSSSISLQNIKKLNWEQEFLSTLGMLPCPYHRYYYLADEMLRIEKKEMTEGTRGEQVQKAEKALFAI